MRLVGLMPVRNEDWCLGLTLRAALKWCDDVVVFLHHCTDRSADIAESVMLEHDGRVHLIYEDSDRWDEMVHRQQMLMRARELGATRVAIVDADEILTANLIESIRRLVELPGKGWLIKLPLYNLRGGLDKYHANGIWGERWVSVVFTEDSRLYWQGDRFHHREPMGMVFRSMNAVSQGSGGVMHLWGASERRLIAKHALYKVIERLRWPGQSVSQIDRTYNMAFDPGAEPAFEQSWRYSPVPEEWWSGYKDLMPYLNVDADPWQAAEVRRQVELHGIDKFSGLDLFAVDRAPEMATA